MCARCLVTRASVRPFATSTRPTYRLRRLPAAPKRTCSEPSLTTRLIGPTARFWAVVLFWAGNEPLFGRKFLQHILALFGKSVLQLPCSLFALFCQTAA